MLINDWRTEWDQGDFPFYFVQLSSFNESNGNSNNGSNWAELREAQTYTMENLENTGMAVTTDIGNANDIHPRNKQDVGSRLAAIALHKDYGKEVVFSGPKLKDYKIEGNKLILDFDHLGSGLKIEDNDTELQGFEIAGKDQKFHKATAKIEGNKVIVYAVDGDKPVAARYAWKDDAGDANLFNKEGFPAIPFRTDDWKLSTDAVQYELN